MENTKSTTIEGKNVGKKCRTHYRGTFNDGTQFDSSYDRGEPLEFVCGAGMMIKGFDAAVASMEVGQTIEVHLMPEEAYGQTNPDAIFDVEIADLPGSEELQVGQHIYLQNQNVIKPEKLVDISYGEYRPIADNSTEEGRIKNRRIEFLLLDNGAKERNLDEYYKEFKSGEYTNTTVVTVGQSQSSSQDGETVPADTKVPADAGTVDTGAEDIDAGTVEAGAEDAGTAADTEPVEEMQNTSE